MQWATKNVVRQFDFDPKDLVPPNIKEIVAPKASMRSSTIIEKAKSIQEDGSVFIVSDNANDVQEVMN